MKTHPILMSAPMVRVLLEGRKTQTRRIIKLPTSRGEHRRGVWEPSTVGGGGCFDHKGNPVSECVCIWNNRVGTTLLCPYGQPGDLLWVRETWGVGTRPCPHEGWYDGIEYRADESYLTDHDDLPCIKVNTPDNVCLSDYDPGWKPSIHMPRWASRLTLELTGVRVERLQTISEEDAKAEGFCTDSDEAGRIWLAMLWDKINGAGAWDANPWVWALTFSVHQQNVDDFLKAGAA